MSAGHLGFYNTASSRTHVRFQFSTHASAGGNVAPLSALEAADLRIYKAADGAAFSATQRTSANGITMTSPFDTLVGVHDVDIDLTDNTDAGFYAAGGFYSVMLAPDETVDGQTITGVVLATFDIGVPAANVTQLLGSAWLTPGTAGTPDVNVKLWNALTTVALPLVPTTAGRTLDVTAANKVNGVVLVDTLTTYTGNTPQTGDSFARLGAPAGASVSADVAAVKAQTAAIETDTAEIGAAGAGLTVLATQASVNAIDDFLDTEIAAILAAVDTEIAAIIATLASGVALTAAERNSVADALLARNVAGGSSAGRTVKEALYRLRNRIAIVAGTATVYEVDDATPAWTAAVTTAASNPVSEVDPA